MACGPGYSATSTANRLSPGRYSFVTVAEKVAELLVILQNQMNVLGSSRH